LSPKIEVLGASQGRCCGAEMPPIHTRADECNGARDKGSAPLATAEAEANAVGALTISPRSPDTDKSVPVFDIARIERTGDAVIAGEVKVKPGVPATSITNAT
jgi:hypothetical protein